MRLRSCIAVDVALAVASSCSSNSTPRLGMSIGAAILKKKAIKRTRKKPLVNRRSHQKFEI